MVLKGWRLWVNKALIIPQRYMLGVLGLTALANAFTMRICLSMSITQMVVHVETPQHIVGEICPDNKVTGNISLTSNASDIVESQDRYDWDEATQGFLLSAFYYGYFLTHLPGGLLAGKFGGKWTVGVGLLVTSVATVLTPLVVSFGGATGLFIMRVIEGCGQGPLTPGFIHLMARWVPPSERSRFGAVVFGGGQLGNIIGPYLSGLILHDGGHWANVFYLFGSLGVVWVLFWVLLCYNTPNDHPFISDEEKDYLNKNVVASGLNKTLDPVPFKAILRSPPLFFLTLAGIGNSWGTISMGTDLPKYFSDILKLNIKDTGLMTALPFFSMYICSLTFGGLCDLCVRMKWHSITTGRKLYTTLSSAIAAVFVMLASYSGCNKLEAVSYFLVAMGLMGAFYCSVKINAMDLAPNYAGTCAALVNGISSTSGIIAPYLTGLLTPDQTVDQWRTAFWCMFAVLVGSNIGYLIWGSGEQQWWDDVDKFGYPPGWKHGPLKRRHDSNEKKDKPV